MIESVVNSTISAKPFQKELEQNKSENICNCNNESYTYLMRPEIKNYVLDTNILLSSPKALFGFAEHNIWITATTLQELDSKKTMPGELGFNARESFRALEELRLEAIKKDESLLSGVELPTGGHLLFDKQEFDSKNLPSGYSADRADNRIMSAVKGLIKANPGIKFVLVTNDVSMRINATLCEIPVESYRNDQIKEDEIYLGRTTVEVTSDLIEEIYAEKVLDFEKVLAQKDVDIYENEFVILKAGKQSALAIYKDGILELVKEQKALSVTPKNAAQTFALYALLAPVEEIPFVILRGPAGTAKTFLSLAAGMSQVSLDNFTGNKKTSRDAYDKILITRNNITADADFGYLPGDIDSKMGPLLAPFYDNLESLLRDKTGDTQTQIEDLFDSGTLDVCPLAYMRGRSITYSYLIVDEAQNSSRSQMRDIITRAGKGTKIIICGDPNQIDNPKLDRLNNGLVYAAEKFKDSKLCAEITFTEEECVRSALATEALRLL